ncbi:MAG TPA: hypothetical protein PLZ79_01570 [Burkholderiales bacterium]|nr:hypothetical protein [Betaproteobacteria bacterium]HQR51929.1 hypothetical protein [Burkholderiales bacterium]
MAKMIPETPPDYDRARVIERPDGFYWQDKDSDRTYGPFPTLWEAMEDMTFTMDAGADGEDGLEVPDADVGIVFTDDDGFGDGEGPIDFDRL